MRTPRSAVAAFAVVAMGLGLSVAGCSSKPDKDIVVYSGRSESLVGKLIAQFTKQTGITVDVRYGSTAQLAAQLQEEGGKSPADLFLAQDAGGLGAVAKAGLLAKLPAEVLSKVPARYQATGGEWVGVTGRSRVFAYNVDQVPAAELPASIFNVTDPKWKGKIGVAPTNGSFQAFITAMRVQHGDAKTKEFLTRLVANNPQIRENNVQIVSEIADGKLAAGLVNHYYVFEKAKELGTTVDKLKAKLHFFAGGDTGALVNVSGVGVLKKADGKDQVRAFVDYLLGVEGQTYFAQQTYEYPLISSVPLAPELPALSELDAPKIDLNDLNTLDATVTMIKESGLIS